MSQYAALLQPFQIKGLRVRNRVMSTAHTSGASEDGFPKERYQRYHEEKAKGGIGLTMIGGSTAVAEDTPGGAMLHLDASTDAIIPYYTQIAQRVKRHGAAIFAQLAHMGRRANWDNQHWLSPISPSRVREAAHRSFPRAMEDWDFKRIRTAFAAASERVKAGGIDGLELSATHGHLIDQFWSPRTNQRTDRYGGSLRDRMTFTFELLHDIRARVGDQYIIGIRISADELFDGGLTADDCLTIADYLTTEGGVDYVSVLAGQAENLPSHATIFPNMADRAAPYLHLASQIKAHIDVPVFHAQKLSDPATAARAIQEGHVDMVAMTRAHIADPHIVKKLQEGRPEDIRPCIGANYCIDRLYAGGQAVCLHNGATGREETMPHTIPKAAQKRRAVVVGAGPGGLEAARVLALRGHEVTVFERQARTGGALNIAAKCAWRETLLTIPRWLEMQARKAGVDLRLTTEADSAAIAATDPSLVILATGGQPQKGPVPGQEHILTVWEALDLNVEPGMTVLLFDDNGAESALSCADYLSVRGARVELVTADPHVGPLLERTTRPTFLRRLYNQGVVLATDLRLTEVYGEGNQKIAVLRNEYTQGEEERAVDIVVADYGTQPDETLYNALKPGSRNGGAWDFAALVAGRAQPMASQPDGRYQLFRIGDAVSSRNVHAAIYEALRLCKDL